MNHLQVAMDLENAAAVIEKRGHTKNALRDDDGAVCAIGGLVIAIAGGMYVGKVTCDDKYRLRMIECNSALNQAIYGEEYNPVWPKPGHCVPDWNNAPQRTAGEVTSMMRAVAATQRAKICDQETALVGACYSG